MLSSVTLCLQRLRKLWLTLLCLFPLRVEMWKKENTNKSIIPLFVLMYLERKILVLRQLSNCLYMSVNESEEAQKIWASSSSLIIKHFEWHLMVYYSLFLSPIFVLVHAFHCHAYLQLSRAWIGTRKRLLEWEWENLIKFTLKSFDGFMVVEFY